MKDGGDSCPESKAFFPTTMGATRGNGTFIPRGKGNGGPLGVGIGGWMMNRTTLEPLSGATAGETSGTGSAAVGGLPPDMPRMRRIETFEEKLYRKFSQEPLVPIGCLITAYFLGSGIRSFYNRDAARSQKMMRLRVGAQFATLMTFIGYYGLSQFNLKVAPGYHYGAKKDDDGKDDK